jgi:hypothetical protein
MNIYNINNEKILEKLRLILVCNKDDFLSQSFNFLILEDCLNTAVSSNDNDSLEILKTIIKPYFSTLLKFSEVQVLNKKLNEYDLFNLSESDQELYKYKFKRLIENKTGYLTSYKELLN